MAHPLKLGLLAAFALFFLTQGAVAQLPPADEASIRNADSSTIDTLMRTTAQRMAGNLPARLDAVTEMQSVYYDKPSKTLVMSGRLLGPIDVEKAKVAQRETFCAQPRNRTLIAKGVTYSYHYTRANESPVILNMTASSCGVKPIN
ncbi:hypothetical protein [Ottowia thiooxydans]|uniref:hypothetical protein n=1 Tax=Ottowia thiooxydans TaxID=219182 RepID=UPI000490B66D|nr:hypothetical protein [Ottowia thiooxydans]